MKYIDRAIIVVMRIFLIIVLSNFLIVLWIKDNLIFGVHDSGRGRIIYLADNPLFRGFWYGGKLLFGNAVFIVGS